MMDSIADSVAVVEHSRILDQEPGNQRVCVFALPLINFEEVI